jgi:hypothetical protein
MPPIAFEVLTVFERLGEAGVGSDGDSDRLGVVLVFQRPKNFVLTDHSIPFPVVPLGYTHHSQSATTYAVFFAAANVAFAFATRSGWMAL